MVFTPVPVKKRVSGNPIPNRDKYRKELKRNRTAVGNFDDGEGHYISTLTPEGHIAYTVGAFYVTQK